MIICFCPNNTVFIANTTSGELTLNANSFLCGFYRGAWSKEGERENPVNHEIDMGYCLKDSDSEIAISTKLTTVGDEVTAKRETEPTARVRYYTIVDCPQAERVTFFTLSPSTKTFYWTSKPLQLKQEDGKVLNGSQTTVAGCVPASLWNGGFTKIVFLCRWVGVSLVPVRPYVYTTKKVALSPGNCVQII